MIKAEVITHEGIPGPNWLDQCRTYITPARTTMVVLAIAVGVLFASIAQDDTPTVGNLPATSTSQQSQPLPGAGLTVQPLRDPSATAPATNTGNVQAPTGSSSADPAKAPANTPLGPTSTPSLNNAKTPGSASQSPQATPENLLNGKVLTDTVQSTVNDVNNLTKPLGGLGL